MRDCCQIELFFFYFTHTHTHTCRLPPICGLPAVGKEPAKWGSRTVPLHLQGDGVQRELPCTREHVPQWSRWATCFGKKSQHTKVLVTQAWACFRIWEQVTNEIRVWRAPPSFSLKLGGKLENKADLMHFVILLALHIAWAPACKTTPRRI